MPTSLVGAANPAILADEATLARDRSIRSHVRWRLERESKHCDESLIVDELPVLNGMARLDLAVLNGVMHGFEIKSERDTLGRLARQAEYFSEVADYMTLIVVDRYVEEALELVPEWWGIAVARRRDSSAYFEMRRDCLPNPSIAVFSFLQFLWRDEAFGILSAFGSTEGLKSATKARLFKALAEQIPWPQLHDAVLRAVRLRVSSAPIGPRT